MPNSVSRMALGLPALLLTGLLLSVSTSRGHEDLDRLSAMPGEGGELD